MQGKIIIQILYISLWTYSVPLEIKGFEPKVKFDRKWLRKHLTIQQFYVTQEGSPEYPYPGYLRDEYRKGKYQCLLCKAELFSWLDKYNTGNLGPSFSVPSGDIVEIEYKGKTVIQCENCGSYVGNVYQETNVRYREGVIKPGKRYGLYSVPLLFEPEDN